MQLPLGVPDPIYLHELALELGMGVGAMCSQMSAHELIVEWPAFHAYRARKAERERMEEEMRRRRV